MKAIVLVASLFLIFSSFAKEQNRDGKTALNAAVGIGYGQEEGFIFHAKPRILKFVLPRLALGMDAEYYTERHYSRYGIGPSIDLYFLSVGELDFVLGQHVLYGKESIHTPGLIGTTDLGVQYGLSDNFYLGLTFGKMYYIGKSHLKPKDPNFVNLAFIFML